MHIYLAPMEGVVDHHLRYLLSRIGGIDTCVTEFVRVTNHVLPEKVFKRYSPELLWPPITPVSKAPSSAADALPPNPGQFEAGQNANSELPKAALCPTRIQLLGSNATALAANARKAASMGAPGIDLNFGCPAKTVNKNRGGACLLKEPDTLYSIVSQVRQAVPVHIPVTAKIRLGFDSRKGYLENVKALSDAGATEIVVHARSKADGYRPPAYWEIIGEIKDAATIPIIANGEIWNVEDFKLCRQRSGCRDVMLGRGLLATPDLALAIKTLEAGEDYRWKTWPEIAEILLEFFEMTSAIYPAKHLGNRAKQWLFYLKRQYPGAEKLFDEIKRSRDYLFIREAISAHAVSR